MYEPTAYAYEAAMHCADCTEKAFGKCEEHGDIACTVEGCPNFAEDSEGNQVGAEFGTDGGFDACDTCLQSICLACGQTQGQDWDLGECWNCHAGYRLHNVTVIVSGAVDFEESYNDREEAEDKAEELQEEYRGTPEAECSIGILYNYSGGLEGSQWAGEEPRVMWTN